VGVWGKRTSEVLLLNKRIGEGGIAHLEKKNATGNRKNHHKKESEH